MELHHGDACWEPLCEDPEAICPSDPALVPILAKEMLELLNNLDSRLGPYLAHGNIGDIGGWRITASRQRYRGRWGTRWRSWPQNGRPWRAWKDPAGER
jgi:hypothetical protein